MCDETKRYFIEEVVDLTSLNFAQRLVEEFRGQRVYIPVKVPHDKHILNTSFDEEELSVLIDNFGGNYIEIPMSLTNEAPHRKAKILELKSKNYGVMTIAKEAGCSWRWVFKVLKSHREKKEKEKNQGNLF